jgi:hypothetical protein
MEQNILLWMIDGFDSSGPIPPSPPTDGRVGQLTQSAFGNGFHRLMQFSMTDTSLHWMRFGLFNKAGMHPILAMGNWSINPEVFFWDLQKLEGQEGEGGFDGVSFKGVPPHGTIKYTRPSKAKKTKDCVRAIAWSPGGEWCVVSGDNGMLLLCSRWGGKGS